MKKFKLKHGYLEYRFSPKGTVELYNIQVEEGFRGKGIGSRLMDKFESLKGNKYLFSRVENKPAHKFYQKRGYKRVGCIKGFYTINYIFSGDAYIFFKKDNT